MTKAFVLRACRSEDREPDFGLIKLRTCNDSVLRMKRGEKHVDIRS